MRRVLVVVMSIALVTGAAAKPAAKPLAKPDYTKAYSYALRCFALSSTDERGGDAASKPAFDAAMKLGQSQGFDNRHINADFTRTSAQEIVKLARSDSYRQQLLADCRKLGLAP